MTIIRTTTAVPNRLAEYRAAKQRQQHTPARPIPRHGMAQPIKYIYHRTGTGTTPMTPENLDNLAAEEAGAGNHTKAAALRAAATAWRRTEMQLWESQRDASLLMQRMDRARIALAVPVP